MLFMILGPKPCLLWMFSHYLNPCKIINSPQNHKQRLWKTINAPLCEGGIYGFGVCIYGFLGVIVLVYLREVGFALSLSLAVWWWLGCGWVEGGVGVGGASLSRGVLGAFLLRGAGWDFSACWREGMGADCWKPHKPVPCELKASRALWDVIYEPLTPPKRSRARKPWSANRAWTERLAKKRGCRDRCQDRPEKGA